MAKLTCVYNCLKAYFGAQLSWWGLMTLAAIIVAGGLLGAGIVGAIGGVLGTAIGPEGTIVGATGGGIAGAFIGALAAAGVALAADILIGVICCLAFC
jgi:hypothetical protein